MKKRERRFQRSIASWAEEYYSVSEHKDNVKLTSAPTENAPEQSAGNGKDTSEELPSNRQIKKPMWFAVLDSVDCWADRTTGKVIKNRSQAERYSFQYAKIEPWSQAERKKFESAFVHENGLSEDAEINNALNSARSFDLIPHILLQRYPGLKEIWSRQRADAVAKHVKTWCDRYNLSLGLFFEAEGVRSFQSQLRSDQEKEINQFLYTKTEGGRWAVVAYGFRDTESRIRLLLGDISLLSTAFSLVDDQFRKTTYAQRRGADRYHLGLWFSDPEDLNRIAEKMKCALKCEDIELKDVSRGLVCRRIRQSGASHFENKGFGLIDICGFSTMAPAQQLQALLALNLAVKQARPRMREFCDFLHIPDAFSRASTGDGFYVWHAVATAESDVAIFVFVLAVLAQLEAMRNEKLTAIRVKAGFTIGEVYTFYEAPFDFDDGDSGGVLTQNAVGPATNQLARLVSACKPGQLIMSDFDRDWGGDGDRLTPSQLVDRVSSALLPRELGKGLVSSPGEEVNEWHESSQVRLTPGDNALLVTDKHGDVFRCWNVHGSVQARTFQDDFAFFDVGLTPETAMPIEKVLFRKS